MSQEVTAEILIDIPRDEAWGKLKDISQAHNYVPGIVNTVIVSGQSQGVGASRYVYRNRKSYIQETVEEWQEGQGFLIRLHRGDKPAPPFRHAWFRYTLEDEGSHQTRFTASRVAWRLSAHAAAASVSLTAAYSSPARRQDSA